MKLAHVLAFTKFKMAACQKSRDDADVEFLAIKKVHDARFFNRFFNNTLERSFCDHWAWNFETHRINELTAMANEVLYAIDQGYSDMDIDNSWKDAFYSWYTNDRPS